MRDRNRFVVLITSLLRATQENEIRWERIDSPKPERPDERMDRKYETSFRQKRFRLFENFGSYVLPEDSTTHWEREIRLEFIDDRGKPLYRVPQVAGIEDLLRAVEYQTSEIDEFLNSLVKSPA